VYDGDGKRVKGTVGGATTVYVGDWYEVGATTKKYYSLGGVRVAMRDSGLGNNPYFLLGDHLGSTSITADSGGSFVAEIRYKAWGESRYANGTTPTSFHFTGQREESTIGLYFYNARWYDPSLSRFAQADTIVPGAGNPQAYNRYSYVLNNPVRYVDPTGHFTEDELLAFGVDAATLAHWRLNATWWRVIMSAALDDHISWSDSASSPTTYFGVFTLMPSANGRAGRMSLGVHANGSGEVTTLQQFYGKTARQGLPNGDMHWRSGIPASRSQAVIPQMKPGGSGASMSSWDPPSPGDLSINDGWAAPTLDGIAVACTAAASVCKAQQLPQGVALGTLCTTGITAYQLGRDAWNVSADGSLSTWVSLVLDAGGQAAKGTWKGILQGVGFIWDTINAVRGE
jgi:RHS repeat-associated protein